jgi:two-component system, NarL family, sensor histidine kinase UhpB
MKTSVRNFVLFSILVLCSFAAYTQSPRIDSLKKVLAAQIPDTNKVKTLYRLGRSYQLYDSDSSVAYAQRALDLAKKLNFERGILAAEIGLTISLTISGNYPLALDHSFKTLSLAKEIDPLSVPRAISLVAWCYYYLGEYNTCLKYTREAFKLAQPWELPYGWRDLAMVFHSLNQPDSALLYAKKSYERLKGLSAEGNISHVLGDAYVGKSNYDSALFFYRNGVAVSLKDNINDLIDSYTGIADVYKATNNFDSAAWYSKRVLSEKIEKTYPIGMLKAANMLADIYGSQNKPDSTLKYLKIALTIKDSLFSREKTMAIQNLAFKEQEKQKEVADSKLKLRNQFIMYFSLVVFVAALVIVSIVSKNNRQKQLQNMRNSIADDLHDDIGSTLSSISILSELAKQKSPEAKSLLDSIGENTLSIQENMSDIVWTITSKNDHFGNVLHRMNQFASEIFDAKNIELDFASDAALSTSRLTMKQRKNFYLFFKEVINNAAKYSDAKKVSVTISKKEQDVEMNISDDGRGFDTTKIYNGNGMSTLKKRGEELNGCFKIQSHLNEGTVVHLKFKIT